MSEEQKLQELSSKLKDTVDRIDKMQQKPSFTARLGRHIRMQSNSIIHAMLAGCIFTVALGRLAQKNEFEEQKQLWSLEKSGLQTENQSNRDDLLNTTHLPVESRRLGLVAAVPFLSWSAIKEIQEMLTLEIDDRGVKVAEDDRRLACRLQQRVSQAEGEGRRLRELVERELGSGGWRLGPVADRIHKGLAETLPGGSAARTVEVKSSKAQPASASPSIAAKPEDAPKPKLMI